MERRNSFNASELANLRLLVKKFSQANAADERKSYRVKMRKIGLYVSDFGITNITPQLFEGLMKSGKIKEIDSLFSQPIKTKIKPITFISDPEPTNEPPNYLFEKLINGTFKKAGDIDHLVTNETGFYCIRLAKDSKLLARYQEHLNNRKHTIIYIGKAENQSLKKRFLGQELRAKGHGTFFRSIGAVLGFLPEKGSLLHAKNKNNYKFTPADEQKIISWINQHLEVNWISYQGDFSIEKEWISQCCPLLNDTYNPKKLNELKEDKGYCRAVATC
ncbi:GIY-YIG nuclease family protein [Flavobacterium frigidarium]|uniref:GIY-YIG nuclease family protein n=1 Tax=Flavobacterium frigidarium TaxID=99286 RepID=UPI0030DAAAA8|tara:strand:- start:1717 stop:2541 length:825 start_codon:yes stop_codon:yes gene_type:complete